MERNILKKRVIIYLVCIYGSIFFGWALVLLSSEEIGKSVYAILTALFSFIPLIATGITRRITHDKSKWYLKFNFKKSWRVYLFAAFVPGLAIYLGAFLFYLLFPNDLDLSGRYLVEAYSKYGVPDSIQLTAVRISIIGIVFIFISPLIFPVHIFALGEEIGWRGYLLPMLLKLMDTRKAILVNGVLWGCGHAPLVYFGFNYGMNYSGAPFTGILMMIMVCIIMGVWLSYVTIQSQSIIPAAIMHGSVNVIGEMPMMVSFLSIGSLVGPNPTGIIGVSGLFLGGLLIFVFRLRKDDKTFI